MKIPMGLELNDEEKIKFASMQMKEGDNKPQKPVKRSRLMRGKGSKSENGDRVYAPVACVPCFKAKIRCDAQRPCGNCQKKDRADKCVDRSHKQRGRPRKMGRVEKEESPVVSSPAVDQSVDLGVEVQVGSDIALKLE
jgi:hypothetical protein